MNDVFKNVSLHGGMQREETSNKSNMKDGVSEAREGGFIASTGYLSLMRPHKGW